MFAETLMGAWGATSTHYGQDGTDMHGDLSDSLKLPIEQIDIDDA